LLKNEVLDKVTLAQKIQNLNIKTNDEISIFYYLDALFDIKVSRDATILSYKNLVKLSKLRGLCRGAKAINDFVKQNKNESTSIIIQQTDKIYSECLNELYINEEEPQDIYEDLIEMIEMRGNNPMDEIGLITPFPIFNKMFGGIRSGNGTYAVVSRPKIGKSTWLCELADGVSRLNQDTYVLILDTEMQTEITKFRRAASITEIPMWYLESGNFRKNKDLFTKWEKSVADISGRKGKVFHLRVAGKAIEHICAIVRRFFYRYIGRNSNKKLLVIYDYMKITGEYNNKTNKNFAEHQLMGDKIDRFNELGGDLDIYLWTAMQLNRSAEGEDGIRDSSAISISDRLQWYASWNGIFARKTLSEMAEFGTEWGSHCLIPIAQRFQGKDATGHFDLVDTTVGKKKKKKYMNNFINYDVQNFRITENGTLRDIMSKLREKHELEEEEKAELNDESL